MSELTPELKPEQYPPVPSAEDVQMAMRILAQLGKPAPRAAGQQAQMEASSEFDLATILQDHNQRLKVLEDRNERCAAVERIAAYTPGWSKEVDGEYTAGLNRGWLAEFVGVIHAKNAERVILRLVNTEGNEIELTAYELRQHIGGCLQALARVEATHADV